MSPKARELTAFTVGNRHFEFLTMPFRVCGGPATFMRLMNRVLRGLDNVLVFGDDALIFSRHFEDHVKQLCAVLGRFR